MHYLMHYLSTIYSRFKLEGSYEKVNMRPRSHATGGCQVHKSRYINLGT